MNVDETQKNNKNKEKETETERERGDKKINFDRLKEK